METGREVVISYTTPKDVAARRRSAGTAGWNGDRELAAFKDGASLVPVHVSAGPVLPRLASQQPQCTADDVAGLLALAAVGLDDAEILFGRAEPDAHEPVVQQLLDMKCGHQPIMRAPETMSP